MPKLHVNPYTGKEGKMVKLHLFVFPEEKAKIFRKKGSASQTVRKLIQEMK